MEPLPDLDDDALRSWLLSIDEPYRTEYIGQLTEDEQLRVTGLALDDYAQNEETETEEAETEDAGVEDAGVEEQAEPYSGYGQQPGEYDYSADGQAEENEESENEDEDEDEAVAELPDVAATEDEWKAPSADEDQLPNNEELFARELDDILAGDTDVNVVDDEQDEDEDSETGSGTGDGVTESSSRGPARGAFLGTHRGNASEQEEEDTETEDGDDDLDIRPEVDAGANKAAIAAIVARNATNRTTTFMKLHSGEYLFGQGHDADIVAMSTGDSGTIRFSRNRMSANDFIVENESGNVDYEDLQDAIRMILTDTSIYDYGDGNRVRVK